MTLLVLTAAALVAALISALLSLLTYWKISAILYSVMQWFLMAWGATAMIGLRALWKRFKHGAGEDDSCGRRSAARSRRSE